MSELSPAAQTVLAAYYCEKPLVGSKRIAAALRAAADQVVPETAKPSADSDYHLMNWSKSLDQYYQRQQTRAELLAIATQAARWGADQELEACCEWVSQWCGRWPDGTRPEDELCASRRPKPPSLAKQGCDALDTYIYGNPNHKDKERTYNTIRAALERLKELEKGNE